MVEKTDASVSITWGTSQTDNGSPHPADGLVGGVGSPAKDLGTPDLTYYSGSDTSGSSLAGAPTDAGTYTVLASFAGNGNYNLSSATKTITIEKAGVDNDRVMPGERDLQRVGAHAVHGECDRRRWPGRRR